MWCYAPWFRAGDGEYNEEPFSYRSWKWLGQQLHSGGWESNLFEKLDGVEWDLVILLDACRYDTLADVATEAVVEPVRSPATATPQFLSRAEADGIFDDTTYISANPQTSRQIPGEDIELVDIHESGWDDTLQTVPPNTVYDEVRARINNGQPIVAHTIQPHYPHISRVGGRVRPVPNGLHPSEPGLPSNPEDGLQVQSVLARGMVDMDRARRSYRAAVEHAWEQAVTVAADLAETGKTTVITSDHGELFGEWGFVEHPVGVPVSELIEVPWVELGPRDGQAAEAGDESVDERLAALGYVQE